MKSIYSLGIRLYGFAILIASLFNEKAKKWRQGRKNIFESLSVAFSNNKTKVIWFHCASLGEFEQGRPVIEAFKQKHPDYKILLTFFSPSGYEVRKNYASADFVFYLPLDTHYNAKRFIEIVNPAVAVFVKYEFWHNYLSQLHKRNTPIYLISAKFRADQYFFKWYGGWFKSHLSEYKKIFVQDTDSLQLLNSASITNTELAGDTRFDRVVTISEQAKPDAIVEAFKGSSKVWVCGSTWAADEQHIKAIFDNVKGQIKLLLVPHEIGESHIKQIEEQFGAIRYSTATPEKAKETDVLVVDKIGLLSSLYKYGEMAYVGGGFGKGIHNLLEAVVWGIPVVFGPTYQKFNEAVDLIKVQGGFSISSADGLQKQMEKLLQDDHYRQNCGKEAFNYVQDGRGATEKIMAELETAVS